MNDRHEGNKRGPRFGRRDFLKAGACATLGGRLLWSGAAQARATEKRKAPYKLLFNNDCTNILTCVSPYHSKGQPFHPDMLRATVDEVKGVDAHLLMPGMGWVPWWKSEVLPIEKQQEWFRKTYGIEPANSYHDYLMQGGDIVQVFVDRCREKGQAPFISFRLNDGHLLEKRDNPDPFSVLSITAFYTEHPEYRIGPDPNDWYQHVQNWAIPEVRDYKFAFIRELCENYDLDGFELDFMRHCAFFNLKETTPAERTAVMTAFVARVRALLDRTARPGQRRWLSARVPCFLDTYDALGIDLPAMTAAGLDMVNVSPFYFTIQNNDFRSIRQSVPDASVYFEMTHATTVGPTLGKGYDNFSFRRNTEDQLCTTAHLAYEQGADGISLFNFVYYREHGVPGRGPFNEPPFDVFPLLKKPKALAKRSQWYYLGYYWNNPPHKGAQLKRKANAGKPETFNLLCAPGPKCKDGTFRIMAEADMTGTTWSAEINGTPLTPVDFVKKPLDHPYDGGLGEPGQYACFACPRACVKNGTNTITLTLLEGEPAVIQYLDLVLPV